MTLSERPSHSPIPVLSHRNQLFLLLAPYLLGLLILVVAPTLTTLALSLTDYDVFTAPWWNDLTNYQNLFVDVRFQRALFNSLWFGLIGVPLRVAGAFLLALVLNRAGRAFEFARATVYLPTIIPEVAYALVWLLIFNPGFGAINLALNAVGLPGVEWLQDPFTARGGLLVMWLFQLGEGFVLMLAALQTISPELFDAAALDGAHRIQRFRYLILPLMTPALLLLAFRDTALSFQGTFVSGALMTGGGPYYATFFLSHYVFDESFKLFKFGYGAAITVVIYLLTLLLIGLQFLPVGRFRYDE